MASNKLWVIGAALAGYAILRRSREGDGGTGDTTAPTPTNLRVTNTASDSLDVAWDAVSDPAGVDHYNVYLDGSKATDTTSTSVSLTGLSADTQYTVEVSAVDALGNESSRASVTATTSPPPDTSASAPSNLRTTGVTETEVSLAWDAASDPSGVDHYNIYLGGSKMAESTTTTATLSGLSSGTQYTAEVSTVDTVGNESGTIAVSFTTDASDTTAPAPSNLRTTEVTAGAVTLAWDAVSDPAGVDHYNVYLDGSKVMEMVNETAYMDWLDAETQYTVEVSTVDALGNESSPASVTFTTKSSGAGGTYFTGTVHNVSDYGSLSQAVNALAPLDTLVIDADVTTNGVSVPSDVKIEGGGGRVRLANGADSTVFAVYDEQNIWIDGVEVDGNRANNSGYNHFVGGPGDNGTVKNLRITNCNVYEIVGNGIGITGESSGDEVADIYVANNEIRGCNNHGAVLGSKNGALIENVLFEGNTIREIDQAQALGVFSLSTTAANGVAYVGNDAGTQTQNERGGQNYVFEQNVTNSIMFGNVGTDWNRGNLYSLAKDARHNLVAYNYAAGSNSHGMACQNFGYYEPNGPPENNVFQHNEIVNNDQGFYYSRCNDNNVIYNNRMANNNTDIVTPNGDSPRVYQNNNSNVTDAGVPSTIGNSVEVMTPAGDVGATATWSAGSADPTDPVDVSVDVFAGRY